MKELLKRVDLYPVKFEKYCLIKPYTLLLLYLYCEDFISLIKTNSKYPPESNPSQMIIAYNDLGQRMHNYTSFNIPHELNHTELMDIKNGITFYALICTIPQEHPLYYCVSEIIDLRKDCSSSDSHKLSRLLFDIYEELNKYTKEYVKENIKDTLKDVLNRRKIYHHDENDDIAKLMLFFLGATKGCIVHPYAPAERYIYEFTGDVFYSAAYDNKETALSFQLFYTLLGVKAKCVSGNIPLEMADFTANYIIYDETHYFNTDGFIWDCLRSTVANNARGVFLVHTRTLLNFKSKCAGASYILSEKISHIIFLSFNIALFVVHNNKKDKGRVILVDETCPETDISVNRIISNIKNKKFCYDLTIEEFEANDFRFSLDAILGNKQREAIAMDKNSIRFDEIVEEIFVMPPTQRDISKAISTKSIHKEYSALKPYYCRKKQNLVWISEDEATRKYENKALFIFPGMRRIIPVIFVYNDNDLEELYVKHPARLYKVDEKRIDIAYLVNEMNKKYYQEQIFPARGGWPVLFNRQILHNSYITLPNTLDSATPTKRQKIFLNEAKQEYIRKLIKEYGLNTNGDYENVALQPGTYLNDNRYEIIECIGSGGYGITYKAYRLVDEDGNKCKQIVALKEFFYSGIQGRGKNKEVVAPIGDISDEISLVRSKFMTEARKIKELDSDQIIKVFDVFDENNTCYYTMEYIDGCNLYEYVTSKTCFKRLKEEEAIRIIRSVGETLKILHDKNTNHFDVKPQNIMISNEGRVVLIDFGAAHHCNNNYENNTYLAYRSDGYSAPDIPQAQKYYFFSPTYDIYSLGATLYFMLTGLEPIDFNDDSCPPFVKKLKSWECIKMSLLRNRDDRPQSIDEFLAMLPS